MTAYRALPDKTLAYVAHQLEIKLAALRPTAPASLREQYAERLNQARAEQQRRKVSRETEPTVPYLRAATRSKRGAKVGGALAPVGRCSAAR